MVTGSRIAVADAGPIIHLDEIGELDLLADFAEVRVPMAVWREIETHRPQALSNQDVRWIKCVAKTSTKIDVLSALYTLHLGEREALQICLDWPGSMFLTDDTAARLAARAVGIDARGTLGILIRSIRTGRRTARQVLKCLKSIPDKSTLHIRPALLDEIRDRVFEADKGEG